MNADQYSTVVRDLHNEPLARSNNLRGLRTYARRAGVACIITRRNHAVPTCGELTVVYGDGAIGRGHFASHAIMIDWIRNRRTWRGAEMRHLDGATGYLTRPGTIAGD